MHSLPEAKSIWHFTHAVETLALVLLFAGGAAAAPLQFQTVTEVRDGTVYDIAAQRANGDDDTKRAWLAQGRVRKAVRISTREWMNNEDESFDLVWQNYDKAPSRFERMVAVEVNEDRLDDVDYLYTLTESALYRQDITDPSNPGPPVWIPLIDTCPSPPPLCVPSEFGKGETMMDFKVWNHPTNAESGKIFLLTDRRVVVLRDRTAAIT